MVTRKPAAKTTAAKTARKTAAVPPAGAGSSAAEPGSDGGKGRSKAASALPSLADLGKMVEKFKLPGIDVNAIVESQRKDMEALAEANRQAYEGIKALAQRRNEILQEALVQWQDAMKDATGKDAMSKRTEMAKKGVQQAIANFRELAEMEAQSRSKAWKVLQDRFQENVANLQKLLKPK
jgi:phasin family protein